VRLARSAPLTTLVLSAAVLLPAGGASAVFPGQNGRIAYDNFVPESTKYCSSPAPPGTPCFSMHVVQSFRLAGRRGIPADYRLVYTCEENIKAPQPRSGCDEAGDPAYAPNGRRLAFVQRNLSTAAGPERDQLAIANDDGTGLLSLPRLTSADDQPAWSPSGASLVFRGKTGSNYDLYLVNADGSGLRRLTFSPAADSDPAWTGARGGWIAFQRGRNLFRIRPDGTRLRRLTRRGGAEPNWSPRGSRIAFTRRGNIHVMRRNGRRVRRLTRRGGTTPVWSPNGRRMLFRRAGSMYVMRSSGRAARPLVAELGRFDWARRP
jgi:WD40-like Beta Propeller Repeat